MAGSPPLRPGFPRFTLLSGGVRNEQGGCRVTTPRQTPSSLRTQRRRGVPGRAERAAGTAVGGR